MSASEFIDLPELMSARGTVRLPGSKSISNRVLLLAALAEGETEIRDLLESDDTARMREALVSLGVTVTPRTPSTCRSNFELWNTHCWALSSKRSRSQGSHRAEDRFSPTAWSTGI